MNQADFPFYVSATVSTIWWVLSASYLGRLVVCPMHYSQLCNMLFTMYSTQKYRQNNGCVLIALYPVFAHHISLLSDHFTMSTAHALHTKIYYEDSALYRVFFSLVPPLKVRSTKKIQARLGVSRPIYVYVDSPNLGFQYFNFLGGYQLKKHPVVQLIVNFVHGEKPFCSSS